MPVGFHAGPAHRSTTSRTHFLQLLRLISQTCGYGPEPVHSLAGSGPREHLILGGFSPFCRGGAAGLLPAHRAALTSLHLSRRERQMPCSCCSCNCKATLLAASLTTLHVTISGTGACGWDGTYTLTWNGSLWRYQNFSPPACSIQNIVFDVTTPPTGAPCCMILRCDCVGCSFATYAILIETSGTTNGTWASCNCSTGNFVANPYSNGAFLCNCSSFTNISVSISP